MIVYVPPVLVTGALAADSYDHLTATPQLCAGHHHHHSHLQLSTVLKQIIILNGYCAIANVYHNIVTLMHWNILIAVAVSSSLGQELDPILDLGYPGVNAEAGTLTSVTNHTNLGESKYIKLINCKILHKIVISYYGYSY